MIRLMKREYDGLETLENILLSGDYGLGTGDKLDGEIIIIDGQAYKATSSGSISPVPQKERFPFFIIHEGAFNLIENSRNLNKERLEKKFNGDVNSKIFSILITGEFQYMKTRTVNKQQKPYSDFNDISENQVEFEENNVEGTLISYFFPSEYKDVGVPGFHYHFLSKDKLTGGHVLDFTLDKGEIYLQQFDSLSIQNI